MAGRFVRASKYRHIFGKPTRKEFCYDNLHISRNAWDSNLIKANPEYLAVNWESSGGGTFAVIPLSERGKIPDQIPLFHGHTAAVLDTDWNPFNDRLIASASDDGKVFLWQVPDNFTLHHDAENIPSVSPIGKLMGHTRKVGYVLFNPSADNILASASGDYTVKIWDVSAGTEVLDLHIGDNIQSMSWSADGSMLVTTSRDKRLRVWDVRQKKPVHDHPGHEGAKNSRAVWMGEHNRIATTGFSRMSDRQIALWEPGNPKPIGGFDKIDSISGVCMPFWDEGSNCLYLAGKGDGNIRYYEYENDKFEYLSEYKSAEPQRGIAFVPRRGVNVHENEVMRAYKTINDTYIEPISFTVPRRAETFQSDLYPPAVGIKPAMSAADWIGGKNGLPSKIDLASVYDGTAPVEVYVDYKPRPTAVSNPSFSGQSKSTAKPEPTPFRRSPPTTSDQKASMSAAANRFKDQDDNDENDDASGFEGVSRPGPTAALAGTVGAAVAAVGGAGAAAARGLFGSEKTNHRSSHSPVKGRSNSTSPHAQNSVGQRDTSSPVMDSLSSPHESSHHQQLRSPINISRSSPQDKHEQSNGAIPASSSSSSPPSSSSGGDIAKLQNSVMSLTKLVLAMDKKLNRLMDEVDKLQKANAASSSHGDKIRQMELQPEALGP